MRDCIWTPALACTRVGQHDASAFVRSRVRVIKGLPKCLHARRHTCIHVFSTLSHDLIAWNALADRDRYRAYEERGLASYCDHSPHGMMGKHVFLRTAIRKHMHTSCMSRRQRRTTTSFQTGWHAFCAVFISASHHHSPLLVDCNTGRQKCHALSHNTWTR